MPNLITGEPPTNKRDPQQTARQCLLEAHNNPVRAIHLARQRARGTHLRATITAIGNALLRASANNQPGDDQQAVRPHAVGE